MDPGAWEQHGVSLTTAPEVCELLPVDCYFLAPGLSQRWYVKVQSIASVTQFCAASPIQHWFVFRTWVR